MRAVLLLALKSAWARRLTLGITLVSIALASALLLTVERVRHDARENFSQTISGVDLVVGPRTGGVQLVLYAVFHSGAATHNMQWDSFDALSHHPAIAWAVPIALGDSHHGFPVLGTTPNYFEHFQYADQQTLQMSAGRVFGEVFETVLGNTVASELGYHVGDRITLAHGLTETGPSHADKPFTVMGILAPTGTPVDRTVHVSMEAITALHLDWTGGAPMPGFSIPAEHVKKFNLIPKEVTAMLIGLKSRSDVFRLQRHINHYRGEPLMAVMPGVALDELWQTLASVENSLLIISVLVVLVGLAGLVATLLAALNERRRELAILRSLGASLGEIFLMLTTEGLMITVLGVTLGYVLFAVGMEILAPMVQTQFGIHLHWRILTVNEIILLLSIIVTGFLVSLIPGWRAWRMSLADGLTPRI